MNESPDRNPVSLAHEAEEAPSSGGMPDRAAVSLPRRDYVILPLLSLLTIATIFGAAEVVARLVWVEGGKDACLARDRVTGPHRLPNCAFRMKSPESPWVWYRFNDCGYRTQASCGPKPAGTLRVAVLGASFSEGYLVPYSQMFTTQASETLTRACHRPVEFQDLGVEGCTPEYALRRINEALALKPDVVLLALNAYDVEHGFNIAREAPAVAANAARVSFITKVTRELVSETQRWVHESRAVLVAQHLLLQNVRLYVDGYLLQGDHSAFLRSSFSPAWERRFADLDVVLGKIAEKTHAAGVPFVILPIPERAQAGLLSLGEFPSGVDPFAFDRKIAQLAAEHGIIYMNVIDAFNHVPNAEKFFYVVDSHLAPGGHVLVGQAVARRFLESGIPAFSGCTPR